MEESMYVLVAKTNTSQMKKDFVIGAGFIAKGRAT
jgi:hypothetical protein